TSAVELYALRQRIDLATRQRFQSKRARSVDRRRPIRSGFSYRRRAGARLAARGTKLLPLPGAKRAAVSRQQVLGVPSRRVEDDRTRPAVAPPGARRRSRSRRHGAQPEENSRERDCDAAGSVDLAGSRSRWFARQPVAERARNLVYKQVPIVGGRDGLPGRRGTRC